MSLAQAIFQRKWLVVILYNNAFGPDGSHHIKIFGFQITPLRDIVRYLSSVGLIYYKKGKKFEDKPSATRVFPEAKLVEQLWMYFLDIEQDINPPYITLKDLATGCGRVINRLTKDHPEQEGMTIINEFIKSHKWACKGPVQLKYNTSALEGGRLYRPYTQKHSQKLPCKLQKGSLSNASIPT